MFINTKPLNMTEIYFKKDEKFAAFSSNIYETKDGEILDDFKEIFNHIGITIIYFSFWTIYMTLCNAFWLFMVLYEKYGEDIMKRSIINHLLSQLCLAMILYNCVCSTLFLCRFILGPLYFCVATFETYIANVWMSWSLLLMAEISIIKALMSNKFSWVTGIDENFAGRFLLRFNVGYLLISQTGRFVWIFFHEIQVIFKYFFVVFFAKFVYSNLSMKIYFLFKILSGSILWYSAFSAFVRH